MKRVTTGRFTNTWHNQPKRRVNLALTAAAWQALEAQARAQGISRSELVERFARELQAVNTAPGERPEKTQSQPDELQRRNQTEQALAASDAHLPPPDTHLLDISAVADCTVKTSECEHLEAQLRQGEEYYRFLTEAIPQLVWTSRPDGWIDYYNRRWLSYTGLSQQQGEGWGWKIALHPDDLSLSVERWNSSILTGEPYEVEYRLRAADNTYRWYLVRALAMLDEHGEIVKWLGTCTDIDDQKRVEQGQRLLAEASSILASSLEYEVTLDRVAHLAVPALADYCSVDIRRADGTVERLAFAHADPESTQLFERLQRRYPYDPRANHGVAEVLRSGKSLLYSHISEEQLAQVARSPEHLALLVTIGFRSAMVVPLVARGRILGAVTFVIAQSHRHYQQADCKLAEELARHAASAIDNASLYREAQQANQVKDEFLATVSHELRTPLNAILGWTQILKKGQLPVDVARSALETVERNARAQNQLIEDILDVSRIVTGKLKLEFHPFALAPLVTSAVETVRLAAAAKHIELKVSLECYPDKLLGDPNRLQQVLWNLLSNAIKFTPVGGRVEVRLERRGDEARLSVSDTGKGIQPELLPHIFERFRQADSSTTRQYGGLGLGLAIVRHFVELHGGTVWATSDGEGKGATFTAALPLVWPTGTQPEQGEGEPDERANGLAGLRVLLVDDEADQREVVSAILSSYGAEVLAVASVSEGLASLNTWHPDILVSDLGMPGEDGYGLIRQLRAGEANGYKHLPAVALTAYAREQDRVRSLEAGFERHLAKPIEPDALVNVLAELTGRASHKFSNNS